MEVHQLIPNFTPGDAMGQAAVAWQRALRRLGHEGQVYAGEVAPSLQSLVLPARGLKASKDALVLYHHGIASPLSGQLLHLPARKGVVFHNITPARFYQGARLKEALTSGRAQLAAMAPFVDVAIGVSPYNVAELEAAGYRDARVVPLFVNAERFEAGQADRELLAHLSGLGRPLLVSVSRVVPHKRMEDLLALHAELRRLAPQAHLLIVGATAPGQQSFQALEARAQEVGNVRFLGRVSHAELVAAYRAADVFVSMSEHEGFGVPLVEAMAADVPVLAFGAAAVPQTMGGRGVVFDEKHFAALAEVARRLAQDAALRQQVVEGQRARVAELSLDATAQALEAALQPLVARAAASARPARRPSRSRGAPRPRVAVVVQRYGEAIVGGAEAHARMVALRLAKHASVEVLTSCAADHLTWKNALPEGLERDGQVRVRRFATTRARRMVDFNRLSDDVLGRAQDAVAEAHWLAEQGPLVPGLLAHLAQHRQEWDAVLFFTYLYAPTVWGVPLVKDKALVVPTAHDEPPLAFQAFADVFELPRALLCNTQEEAALIESRFPKAARTRIVGVGVEPPSTNEARFREKYGLRGPYLMYVGRLEAGKGVPELVKHHQKLVKRFHDAPALVLAGAGDAPRGTERLKVLGRIDEQDKWDGLAGALAAVVPSQLESLSLLTLEAMAVGTPVLGRSSCVVVAGHLRRSGAGATWDDAASFAQAVQAVGEAREEMSPKARRYAEQYRWTNVVDAFLEEIEHLRKEQR